ncbi:MAG: hypothetical protein IIA65_07840, partial [Planctomycetes bacterium]|nr:hypothetical protein [Planctomycetota bacterium]
MIDGAIDFDGATGYVEIPPSASLRVINQGDFTVAAWFKVNVINDFNLMQQLDAGGTGRTWLYVVAGEIRTFIGGGTTGSGVSPVAGEWYHAAVVATEGSPDTQQVFVNGLASGQAGQRTAEDSAGGYVISASKTLTGRRVDGLVDDMQFYDHALTEEEMQQAMKGIGEPMATSPSPGDGATDVSRDVTLSWAPAELAEKRNVYFGTVFDDVNNADAENPMGVLVSTGQVETTYQPPVRLDFDTTYYWRVDEVNGAPDFTVFKGAVWSFTAEPLSLAITGITATASSSFALSVPENTINGSGLVGDLHGASAPDMWISAGIPATIEYAFDRAYKLHELWVWNSNQFIEPFVGFGAKDVVIEHSLDGENWTVLEGVGPLAQAPGTVGYAHNNTIGFDGVTARHVRMTINSVQGIAPQASLS